MNVFEDQARFMRACKQSVLRENSRQATLYLKLMDEELSELRTAIQTGNKEQVFDAVLDVLVVTIGYGLSRGLPLDIGWKEVMRSNMAKIDPKTGEVRRRDDGKILKPDGWSPPDLKTILEQSNG